ncbi:oxidoreductase [Rhodococcus sp. NPDC058505]|uniref:oxidoreductase n=1 Tax=unclassified Rhodococcus (in: high G+C Gram-positive bacteria) TaxID=192944 RepID=UPI00364D61B0
MGLRKLFGRGGRRAERVTDTDARYLAEWARTHIGVEAFVEPRTTVTPLTVMLVAADGQWTRRAVGGERGARRLGEDLHIPVYDVRKTGYPQRMRDHEARQKILRNRAREA